MVSDQVRVFHIRDDLAKDWRRTTSFKVAGLESWKPAPSLPVRRDLARDHHHRGLIRAGGGHHGDHIGNAGPPDGETHAKTPAGPGIAVGHAGAPPSWAATIGTMASVAANAGKNGSRSPPGTKKTWERPSLRKASKRYAVVSIANYHRNYLRFHQKFCCPNMDQKEPESPPWSF